ncbi:MAG: GNAT family N-acetyltransferase [Bellilinea sp.]|jgi:GNAT superfamily N-acetyltransferase
MHFHIRNAKLEDAPALAEVLRSVEWFTQLIEKPIEDVQRQITRSLEISMRDDSHLTLVAESGAGRVLGYIAAHWVPFLFLDGAEGYISELFVHKAARGSGIGSRLLTAICEEARLRGCARLMLLNGRTRESYQREFYKKRGWRERETMVNFILEIK